MRARPDITELSFDRQVQELARWAEAQVSPFRDRSQQDKQRRKARAAAEPFYFFRTYLPHYFYDDPAPFHREMIQFLEWRPDRAKHQVVTPFVVAAPRGYAKSTNVSFGYPLHQAVTKRRRFTILGSETGGLASSLVAAIKAEFEGNRRLQYDWGQSLAAEEIIEGAVAFVTSEGCAILARGMGQQVRGLKYRQYRPDLVVLDDLESNKSVVNPKMVTKRLNWVLEEILPGMDVRGSLFILGTIISLRSALAIMLSDAEPYCNWRRKVYRGLNEKEGGGYWSLWPARFPVETLLELKRVLGSRAFNKEHQNLPSDEDAAFPREWIDKHGFELGEVPPGKLPTVGFLDPSISKKPTADFRAVACLARAGNGDLLINDAYLRKEPLPQVFNHILAMHRQHRFFNFGCEDNAFQELVGQELTRLAKEAGVYLPVTGVTHSGASKEMRIMRLSPLVQRGVLRFPRPQDRTPDMRELVEQFCYYPNFPHDDGPDAVEGGEQLMEKGLRAWPGAVLPAGRAA